MAHDIWSDPDVIAYADLLDLLHEEMKNGRSDSVAESLREEMANLWYQLNSDCHEELDKYSEELYQRD